MKENKNTEITSNLAKLVLQVRNLLDDVAKRYDLTDKSEFSCKYMKSLAETIDWEKDDKSRINKSIG